MLKKHNITTKNNMSQQEKVFPAGLIYKAPSPRAPQWVKANISVKVDEFIGFLKQYDNNGWVNIDVKESKGGKIYCELSTYKREEAKKDGYERHPEDTVDEGAEIISTEDIPF